ncbi:TonB-dependent receptor plug domain-containing protein [Nostoc sp. LPT]|uniref:TonB-dependent receptor plug domain-containing protein n=1 Tax=Nostoc sp. LPT TaxID=2815387 RepID=UPI0025EE24A9|nr:TonB-dependent receptor plug domain-containing protein [Nostoc sp. LPT]
MKSWQSNIYLMLAASLVEIISILVIQPAWAEAKLENRDKLLQKGIDNLHQQIDTSNLGDRLNKLRCTQKSEVVQESGFYPTLTLPEDRGGNHISGFPPIHRGIKGGNSTCVHTVAQQANAVPITSVKANATDKGVEVILETPQGTQLQVTNRSTGNNFIVDVSGGQLRLQSGDAFTFRSEKPLAGITEITVTNIDANTVRVTVVGEKALPAVELFDDNAGLVFAVASQATAQQPPQTPQTEEQPAPRTPQEEPAPQQDEPIELVVTGEQDGYRVQNSSTATRTDTPLRDIPASIQVVPQQLLEDRNVRSVSEAIQTVSGVLEGGRYNFTPNGQFFLRGFTQGGNFRNGFRDAENYSGLTGIATIEQVEVLKGPASILFRAVEPGGIINVVTKQPLSEPYYKLGFDVGSYGYYLAQYRFLRSIK